jgi:hypothetical protein
MNSGLGDSNCFADGFECVRNDFEGRLWLPWQLLTLPARRAAALADSGASSRGDW